MPWKKIGRMLLHPPLWLILLFTVLSASALVVVFLKKLETAPFSYVAYILSFYTLSVLCIFLITVLPERIRSVKERVHRYPLLDRFFTDPAFRTYVSLHLSFAINLLYAGANALFFGLYRSFWFVGLAVYYATLAVMRFLLLRYRRSHAIREDLLGERRRARLCAYVLLTVNFALSATVLMILYRDRGFAYPGLLIYVMAAYTFYVTVHAIVSLIKYRKYQSPVLTAAKVISLSGALVSMLALETAMLSAFGAQMTPESKWLFVALTGAGVSVAVIAMSLAVIIKNTRELQKSKESRYG